MRKLAVALIAAVLSLAGLGAANAVNIGPDQSTPVMESQDRIIHRTGIIRLGTSVYLHANTAHGSVGITSHVLSGGCRLVLRFDTQPGERVLTILAGEDETLARLNVQAGGSGGLGEATIYLYRNGSEVCANSSIFGSNANIWFELTSEIPAP